jgi:large subunit ribosomal protein L24
MKIRSGDVVEILTGDDRGKQGKVLRTMPGKDRVVVEGVNVVYKHVRKTQQNPRGGRIEKEAPIHVSNVRVVTRADSGKAARKKSGKKEKEKK